MIAMKKGMKQELDDVLNMSVPDKIAQQLRQFGVKEKDINNETAIAVALYQQAVKGNVNAITAITKMTANETEIEKEEKKAKRNRARFVKMEVDRISKIYDDMTPDRKELARPLIENAGFLSAILEELRQEINNKGIKEKYQNGNNQSGFKDSIETKTYTTFLRAYMSVIKQLSDMLPNANENVEDEFDRFCDEE